MGRRRSQAPRHRRGGRLRPRAEDRRACGQPDVRERPLRAGRDAWRRRSGRRRLTEPTDRQGDPAAPRGRAAGRDRGPRRGISTPLGLPGAERAPGRDESEARAESSQRCGRQPSPEELRDHGRPPALDLGLRCRTPRRRRVRDAVRDARVAARARPAHESVRRAARVDRGGRRCLRRVGKAANGARLRDRRRGRQGRLPRPTAAARSPALPSALGARVQVGADDGGDAVARDPHPRGAHRSSQPVGDHGAGAGRRCHGHPRDAAQRGGHQPQADPPGRRRHRPARR